MLPPMVRGPCFLLLLTTLLTGCDVESSVGERRGLLFGIASNDGVAGPTPNLDDLEARLGRRLRLDRIYRQWDSAAPSDREADTLAAGRTPIVSFNGRRPDAEPISWASVARGDHDEHLVAVADAFAHLEAPVFALFHQNADDNEAEFGTAEEFRDAYRHVVELFRSRGATNVVWVFTLRSPAFATRADEFYPGDDVVDWIGVNAYNYGTEAEGSRWISLRGLLSDFLRWSSAHPKPLMIAESGCTEDPNAPGRKARWFDEALTTLREEPRIRAAVYFHRPDTPGAADSSPDAFEAFSRLALDPYTN